MSISNWPKHSKDEVEKMKKHLKGKGLISDDSEVFDRYLLLKLSKKAAISVTSEKGIRTK